MTTLKAEPITKAEWESVAWKGTVSVTLPLLSGLSVGAGFKIPCTWKHGMGKARACSGTTLFTHASKRYGIKIFTRCKDKVLYVWREA